MLFRYTGYSETTSHFLLPKTSPYGGAFFVGRFLEPSLFFVWFFGECGLIRPVRGFLLSGPGERKVGDTVSKYDWRKIAQEYIEGVVGEKGDIEYPSLNDLVAKYGFSLSTVGRQCSRGQWPVKRERFANKVGKKRESKKAETLSDESARYDLECFNISRDGIAKAKAMLAEASRPSDLATLARALKDLQAVAKTAIGETGAGGDGLMIEVKLDED